MTFEYANSIPRTLEATRLHREIPNVARFHVIVFAGEPEHTSTNLKAFSTAVELSQIFSRTSLPISWITIPAKVGPSAFELLGIMPFGKVFYDQKHKAHLRYGVDIQEGATFVMRPDGWVGTATALKAEAVKELEDYFHGVLLTR